MPSLKLIAPIDLTSEEAGDVQRAFESEGLSTDVECTYFIKSAEHALANFVVELAREAKIHGIDKVLDLLYGAIGAEIANAFRSVRKRLSDRKVQVRMHIESPHRLSYILPQPPEFDQAIKDIKAHYKSLPPDARGDVFWYDGAWITSAEYWERHG